MSVEKLHFKTLSSNLCLLTDERRDALNALHTTVNAYLLCQKHYDR